MAKILILGGSYLQSHFIKKSLNLGHQTLVVDGNKFCYAAIHRLGEFFQLDFSKVDEVKAFCLKKEIKAVIAPVNELGNVVAAEVAAELGFYYNPLNVVKCSTDKKLIWEKLENSNFNKSKPFSINSLESIEYPVIVKPTVSTSSKGVSLVKNSSEVGSAIDYAQLHGKTSDVRIEEFIEGRQYSLETITFKGEHYLLAIIEENLSNEPYFFERADVLDSSKHQVNHTYFNSFVMDLLTTLEVECGPCHIEVRVKEDKIYLIDFATRSGGWRDIMLDYSGIDFNTLILNCYLGEPIEARYLKPPVKTVGAAILLYHDDLLKLRKANESGLLRQAYLNGELPLIEPKSLSDAYGYYFLTANSISEMQGLLPIF